MLIAIFKNSIHQKGILLSLAPVARAKLSCLLAWFSLSRFARWWRGVSFLFRSNGNALRAGQSAGLFFSLSRFARWWRGAVFSFGQMALRSARARGGAVFFFELVLALVARGRFFLLVKRLCAPRGPEVGRGVSNPPSLPLDSTLPATS